MGAKTGPDPNAARPITTHAALPSRRLRRGRDKRFRPEPQHLRPRAEQTPEPMPDPVRIAVLAMEGLARASMRASFTGTEVRVAVPDAAIAAIFQAAIAQTVLSRSTDRLIRIVVE